MKLKSYWLPVLIIFGWVLWITGDMNMPVDAASLNVSEYHQALNQELNRLRQQNDLPILQVDSQLEDFSQQRAQDLAQQRSLSHDNNWGTFHPNSYTGENLERIMDTGNVRQNVVNALAFFYDDYGNPDYGHRKNMLNPLYTQVGVGIAQSGDGVLYLVQTFWTPDTTNWSITQQQQAQAYYQYTQASGLAAEYPSTYDLSQKEDWWQYPQKNSTSAMFRLQGVVQTLQVTPVFDHTGQKITQRFLPNASQWYTNCFKMIGGQPFYQVAADEWLPARVVKCLPHQ